MSSYQLPPGTVVGERYRIEYVLGEGGYGITYYGRDSRLDLPVAVKEYYPSFWVNRYVGDSFVVRCQREYQESYEKGLERFHGEAVTLAHLHMIPEIVLVRDYFEENNTGYLVMEYLDGQNLKQMTDGFEGRIPPDILMPVMEPLILAVKKVHDLGLIHRDISPDNIMMLENGNVKLLDFGNARDTTEKRSMTLAMKQGFAPPEQYRSRGQGIWTDVYGVCATMYYCLSGKLPVQAMERLTGTPLPTLAQLGVSLPPWQEEAILQGLDLFVNKRPQSMEELWKLMYGPRDAGTHQEGNTAVFKESGQQDGKTVCMGPEDGFPGAMTGGSGGRILRTETGQNQDISESRSGIFSEDAYYINHDRTAPQTESNAWEEHAGSGTAGQNGRFREICRMIFRKVRGF